MKTLLNVKADYVTQFKNDLRNLLEGLDSAYRPAPDRISEIIEINSNLLNIDDLLLRQFTGESHYNLFNWGPFPDLPLPQLPPLPDLNKEACILAHIAIAAAVLAAWVASGGTLTIGTSIAGVTITNEIIAALIGGASGRVLAEKFC